MADNKKSSIKKGSSVYLLNVKQPDRSAKRLRLGFRSVPASLFFTKSNRSLDTSVSLLDMSETGAGIYTPELLRKGTPVQLILTEPYPLRVNGMVIWSMPVASSVHNARFRCRAGVKFLFANEMDQSLVKEFLEKILIDPVDALRTALNTPPVSMPPMPGSPEAAAPAAPATPPADAAPAAAPTASAEAASSATPAPDAPAVPVAEAAPAAPSSGAAPAPAAEAPPAPTGEKPEGGNSGDGGSQAA